MSNIEFIMYSHMLQLMGEYSVENHRDLGGHGGFYKTNYKI